MQKNLPFFFFFLGEGGDQFQAQKIHFSLQRILTSLTFVSFSKLKVLWFEEFYSYWKDEQRNCRQKWNSFSHTSYNQVWATKKGERRKIAAVQRKICLDYCSPPLLLPPSHIPSSVSRAARKARKDTQLFPTLWANLLLLLLLQPHITSFPLPSFIPFSSPFPSFHGSGPFFMWGARGLFSLRQH